MKIEAIITCVNYSDFLSHTLPLNKIHFDQLVVVTTPQDRATRDVCEHNHVTCVMTDAFHRNGETFNKGAAITEGLKKLSCSDWVCHLDADIVLPPRTREMLGRADLQADTIYGIDRLMCRSFDDWARYTAKPEVQHSCDIFVQANAFPLGVRIARLRGDGWVPIGFFQLWNAGATGRKTYCEHGAADRGDMRFASQWPRSKRVFIPEIVAIHLESESSEMGTNWAGRATKIFTPAKPKKPWAWLATGYKPPFCWWLRRRLKFPTATG